MKSLTFVTGSLFGAAILLLVTSIVENPAPLGSKIATNIENLRNGGTPMDVYASTPRIGQIEPSVTWLQHLDNMNGAVPSNCLIGKRYLQGVYSELLMGELVESKKDVSQNLINICQ